MPVKIPDYVQEFMKGKPGWVATASRDGMPRCRREGLAPGRGCRTPAVCRSVLAEDPEEPGGEPEDRRHGLADNETRKGYILKGTAELLAHGPLYEQTAAALKQKLPHLPPPKYVVRIAVEAVFDQSLGPDAGKQIA